MQYDLSVAYNLQNLYLSPSNQYYFDITSFMFIWQPTSNGEITRVPGRRPLVNPDLQNDTSTKNKALALFMLGFVILAPLLFTFAKLSQNNLP